MLAVSYSPWEFQDGKMDSSPEAYIYDLEAGRGYIVQTLFLFVHFEIYWTLGTKLLLTLNNAIFFDNSWDYITDFVSSESLQYTYIDTLKICAHFIQFSPEILQIFRHFFELSEAVYWDSAYKIKFFLRSI